MAIKTATPYEDLNDTLPDSRYLDKTREEVDQAALNARKMIEDNYVTIDVKYVKLVLPFDDATLLVSLFKKAEILSNEIAWDYLKIIPLNSETVNIGILSREDYIEFKMRTLLKINTKPQEPF